MGQMSYITKSIKLCGVCNELEVFRLAHDVDVENEDYPR